MRTAVGCLAALALVVMAAGGVLFLVFGARTFGLASFQVWPMIQWRQVIPAEFWRYDIMRSIWPTLAVGAAWFGRWTVSLVVGLAACSLFPHRIERMAWYATAKPWSALGMGILAAVASGTLIVLTALTIIGIPLALLLAGCLALAQAIGFAVVGLIVGQRIRTALGDQEPDRPLVDVAFGITLLMAVGLVPGVGWLVSLAARAVALGMVAATRLGAAVE